MKVRYDGPYGAVEVRPAVEGVAPREVAQGQTADFPPTVAESLLATGEWSKVKAADGGKEQ